MLGWIYVKIMCMTSEYFMWCSHKEQNILPSEIKRWVVRSRCGIRWYQYLEETPQVNRVTQVFWSFMFDNANDALSFWIRADLQEQKSDHWMKPGSKFFFYFAVILESKLLYRGGLDISLYQSLNQKVLSTAIKKNNFCHIFRNTMFYNSGHK